MEQPLTDQHLVQLTLDGKLRPRELGKLAQRTQSKWGWGSGKHMIPVSCFHQLSHLQIILLASAQHEEGVLSKEVRAFSSSIACSGQWQSGPVFLLEKPRLGAFFIPPAMATQACLAQASFLGKDIQSMRQDKLTLIRGLQPPCAA